MPWNTKWMISFHFGDNNRMEYSVFGIYIKNTELIIMAARYHQHRSRTLNAMHTILAVVSFFFMCRRSEQFVVWSHVCCSHPYQIEDMRCIHFRNCCLDYVAFNIQHLAWSRFFLRRNSCGWDRIRLGRFLYLVLSHLMRAYCTHILCRIGDGMPYDMVATFSHICITHTNTRAHTDTHVNIFHSCWV